MTENTAPIEDRDANIKATVQHILDRKTEEIFAEFDRLHRRNIHDNDIVTALRSLHEEDLLDSYAEWAEIDLREDDNTTRSDTVPDPAGAPSYDQHPLNQRPADITTIEQLALLDDGVVLALKDGRAGQIRRDHYSHDLVLAGSDLWISIRRSDGEGSFDSIEAYERRELDYYLPATVLGSVK